MVDPGGEGAVDIVDRGQHPLDPQRLHNAVAAAATAAAAHAGQPQLAVTVLLTDDEEIAELHRVHFDDPTPTDVITFPFDDDTVDLAVSVTTAMGRAAELGHDPVDEVALYTVHGVLHACGFDDLDDAARRDMRDAERAVLAALGIRVAPVDG